MTPEPKPSSVGTSRRRFVQYGGGGGASARWFRYSWITLLALLVLAVTGYGAYRVLKPWRARNLARQAEQAFRQRDFARSQATMRAALRMGPADPEVLHITAQLLSSAGSIEGLEYWQRFFSVHAGSEADRLSYLDVALRFNRVDLAWPTLNTLIRLRTNDVSLLHRGVRLMLQADDPVRAEPWARRALLLNPAAVSNQLVLGEALFLSANPVKNAEGRRLMLPLALGHGAEQVFAATLLADQASLGQAERRQIAQALRDHGPTNATTRLLIAQLSLPVERPARDAALARVVQEFGGDDSLRAPLAAWFFRRGEAASALTILPLDRCITNPPWLHARLEALVRARAWGELGTTLTRPNLPLSPLRQFAFTGQHFAGTGHPVEAAANFLQALQNAKPEPLVPDPLRWLANQAESAGLPASAAAAWEQRMRNPRATVTSGREAVRLLTPLNEEVRLRAVLRQLNLTMPTDISIATEFAWVSAMLNAEPATARDLLRDARQQRPEAPDYRFGLALAELRLSHAAAALALVEESPVDWDKLLPRSRVTYVAVLAANQQREAARKFARKLDPARLKNAQRALLQEWVPAE